MSSYPSIKRTLEASGGRIAAEIKLVMNGVYDDKLKSELIDWAGYLRISRGYELQTTVCKSLMMMRRFFTWLHMNKLDSQELTPLDFDRYQQWLFVEKRHGARHRANQVIAVRMFYRWRDEMGYGANLAKSVRPPKHDRKLPIKYSKRQLKKLFSVFGDGSLSSCRDKSILLFLLATGARRQEVATLKDDQVELHEKTAIARFIGKGSKERDVPFEGPAVLALQEWLTRRNEHPDLCVDGALWVGMAGVNYGREMKNGAYDRIVNRIAKRARLKTAGVHRFRVTFATQMYDSGVDIEVLRILMGHESIETTRRYILVSDKARQVRLSSALQHEVLGTAPEGLPLWARSKFKQGGGYVGTD